MKRFTAVSLSLIVQVMVVAWARADVPSTYQQAYSDVDTNLQSNQQTVASMWNGTKTPVLFGTEVTAADGVTNIGTPSYYAASVTPYLNGLQTMGIKSVKFLIHFPMLYPPFYTWFQAQPGLAASYPNFTLANNTAFYERLIADLHSRGIKVVAQTQAQPATSAGAYTGDPLELTTYYYTLSFNDYVVGRGSNTLAVATLNPPPDFINYDSEPDTEGPKCLQPGLMPSSSTFVANNLTLVTHIRDTLENAGIPGLHTTLKTAIGMGNWEEQLSTFIQNFTTMANVDIIDIHVHIGNNNGGGTNGSPNELNNIETIASAAIAQGKGVGADEEWVNKEANSEVGVTPEDDVDSRNYWSFWQPIDQLFVQDLVQTGYLYNMAYVDFSVPDVFFNYLDYNTLPSGCSSLPCTASQWDTADVTAVAADQALSPVGVTATGIYFDTMTDQTPPSVPAGLSGTVANSNATIQWSASTDNQTAVPLTYAIERNSVQVATTSALNWTDTSLASGMTYVYQVQAIDGAGNLSALSAGITLVMAGLPHAANPLPYNAVTGQNGERITVLISSGAGRVSWSKSGNDVIAYDALIAPTTYQVFTMNPNGSQQSCLTCSNAAFSAGAGSPQFDPTGQHIIFQSLDPNLVPFLLPDNLFYGNPGQGHYNNVWVMNANGSNPQQITFASTTTANGDMGVLYPAFSNGGTQVVWAQKTAASKWAIQLGSFNAAATPMISATSLLYPAGSSNDYLYETYGWLPGDTTLIFASTEPGATNFDIYTYVTLSSVLTDLTNQQRVWNEHAHFQPTNPNKLLLMEGTDLQADLWMMNADGSNETQYTFFNDATAREYAGGETMSGFNNSWRPDGQHFVVLLKPGSGPAAGDGAIARVDLPGSLPLPTNLTATAASATEIDLSWSAITDPNAGATVTYIVFSNGVQITTTTALTYANTGLTASTTYAYQLEAIDTAYGNSGLTAVFSTTSTPVAPPPPTITSPAAANPSPVSGKTTTLSVAATDANYPTSSLTYSWVVTGTPPATPQLATPSAASTLVTFSQAGTYNFQVTVKNPAGDSVPSTVQVVVNQTVTSVTVTPASVQAGSQVTVAAAANDQFGNAMNPQPSFNWSVAGGGAINPTTGVFTAGNTAGTYTVTATAESVPGTGSVTVTNGPPPTITSPAAANPSPVSGKTTTLSVAATDANYPTSSLTYSWVVTGTPPATPQLATPSAASTLVTFSQAGTYNFQVTVKNPAGDSVPSSVQMVVEQTLNSIVVTAPSGSLQVNTSYSFTASALDQFGNAMASPTLSWSVQPTATASIDNSGNFTAANAGVYVITAQGGGVMGSATVSVGGVVPPPGPVPVLTSLSPIYVTAGDSGFMLTVNGTGFAQGASILFNGSSRTTIYTSATQVQAAISVGDIASVGNVSIAVTNPGRNVSNSLTLGIVLPPQVPVLDLPEFLPLNAVVQFTDSLDASFQWTLNSQGNSAVLHSQSLDTSEGSPTFSAATPAPALNLGTFSLSPGPITIQVVAVNKAGQASAPGTATVTLVGDNLNAVRIYPNPWRSDKHQGIPITFDHLTLGSTIKLFDTAGRWVKTLTPSSDSVSWDRTNDSGDTVASGLYLYLITDNQGNKTRGVLTIIK